MMLLDRRRSLAALAGTAFGAAAGLRCSPHRLHRASRWLGRRSGCSTAARWSAAQAEGKAVVAVFWSTTCPFCRRHNAHVEKLRQAAAASRWN